MPRIRFIQSLGGLSLIGVLALWGEAPWRWGFVAYYFGATFLFERFARIRSRDTEQFVRVVLFAGTAPLVVRAAYGPHDQYTWWGFFYVVSLMTLAMSVGTFLGLRLKPHVPAELANTIDEPGV